MLHKCIESSDEYLSLLFVKRDEGSRWLELEGCSILLVNRRKCGRFIKRYQKNRAQKGGPISSLKASKIGEHTSERSAIASAQVQVQATGKFLVLPLADRIGLDASESFSYKKAHANTRVTCSSES